MLRPAAHAALAIPIVLAVSLAETPQGAAGERPALTAPDADRETAGPVSADRLYVVLLNGGGSPDQNYSSHLAHIRQIRDLLGKAGVPDRRITIFSSDGEHPDPDQAVSGPAPLKGQWLLDGTLVGEYLAPYPALANSKLPGVKMQPARKRVLRNWFARSRKTLKPGDTLLLFVTDHGINPSKDAADPRASEITLWGRERLSVQDLRLMLQSLPTGVRTVTLMSQCFSGGFAHLMDATPRGGLPTGNTCGYFSSTANRPAYGCYAANEGADQIGHAFEFLRALSHEGNFSGAHLSTIELDDTPDVPLRSSDVYLRDLVQEAADEAKKSADVHGDALLALALRDRKRWEPEIRLLDRLGEAYGVYSPRSFAEVARVEGQIHDVLDQIDEHGKAWGQALGDLTLGNLHEFVKANREWESRLRPRQLNGLPTSARMGLAHDLLEELLPFSEKKKRFIQRLKRVFDRSDAFESMAYRMEVRLAALLRMRTILTHIAGLTYLQEHGSTRQKSAHGQLTVCEDLTLPQEGRAPRERSPARFSGLAQDIETMRTLVPAGLGIIFRSLPDDLLKRYRLQDGAAVILRVMPDTPAAEAGLEVGDIVVGEPDRPFTHPNQVRAWTMLSPTGTSLPLVVLRDQQPRTVSLTLEPRPTRWPDLPAEPKLGSLAPQLGGLKSLRGKPPREIAAAGPYVLFFWATWCGPCKAAIPELLDYSARRNVPIIAVTDEDEATVKAFLSTFENPFPPNVVSNELRTVFSSYGVSATPTFVLIGADGTLADRARGYSPQRGLQFRNWRWRGE